MVNKATTCRCCLVESKAENELYEFSSEVSIDNDSTTDPQNFVKIAECFQHLTNILVPEDVEDTSKICSQCLGDLKFCYMFQRKCLDAEKTYVLEEDKSGELIEALRVPLDLNFQRPADDFHIVTSFKNEEEMNVTEYVEEEYVEGTNDEETNDGFEDEHGMINQDDEKETNSSETMEDGPYACDLCPKVFGK